MNGENYVIIVKIWCPCIIYWLTSHRQWEALHLLWICLGAVHLFRHALLIYVFVFVILCWVIKTLSCSYPTITKYQLMFLVFWASALPPAHYFWIIYHRYWCISFFALITCVRTVSCCKCWFRWKWCLAFSCCPIYYNIVLVLVEGFWQSHCFRSQVTIACAMVMCHRFYMRQSHAKNDWQVRIFCIRMFLNCIHWSWQESVNDLIVCNGEIDPSNRIWIMSNIMLITIRKWFFKSYPVSHD